MRKSLIAASLVAFLACPATAPAETVVLGNGDVLEGKVADHGDRVLVTTEDGVVSVKWRDVDVVHLDDTARDILAARREAAGERDASKLYAVALAAVRAGVPDEALAAAKAVVAIDPEHEGARDLLAQQKVDGDWLSGEALLEKKGFVQYSGTWMLAEEAALRKARADKPRPMDEGEVRVQELIARMAKGDERAKKFAAEAIDGLPDESVARPALRALRRGKTAERVVAAGLLAKWGDVDAVRPLIRAAVMDRESSVRTAAIGALKKIEHTDTARPLGKALYSESPVIAAHAAMALGEIGGAVSIEYIVRRVQSGGGPGGRNHIFVGRQISYISDFDVEIAQFSQIGDPIVGTIREGVMLDTRVISAREEYTTVERRAFYGALRKATGQDFGENATAWANWWEDEGRASMTAAK